VGADRSKREDHDGVRRADRRAGTGRDIWPGQNEPLTTWPISLGLHVKPGTYRVRIAAIDSNGRQGTVDDQVVAELGRPGLSK
jgi:hypothetical protein